MRYVVRTPPLSAADARDDALRAEVAALKGHFDGPGFLRNPIDRI
jgi:hypothetical protein